MMRPLAERRQRLRTDAKHAKNRYLQDGEWATLHGVDLRPDD
jgi:hypothetical protein